MNLIVAKVCVVIVVSLLITGPVAAQGDQGCITEECHARINKKEFVHGPVGAGACTICHNQVEGKKHEFVMTVEKEELCFGCHEAKRDMMLEDHRHTPVAKGNCVGCHDPHQSDHKFQLRGDGAELCYGCHEKEPFSMEHVHGPVGAGDCVVCHNPHASANQLQLRTPLDRLCFTCHDEMADIPGMRHVHPPVAEKCINCHSPHSNKAAYMLSAEPPELCFSCHEEIAGHLNLAHQHQPVALGQCLKCHDVHASENPRMFLLPQMDLCLSCHEEKAELVAASKFRHGPVKEGDCNACHDPHGSENHRILRHFFPSEFYMPFATENYAICFQCHNKDIALDPYTTTLTDFRNGDVNLHFKHVNKEVKGRSCKACHEVHASNQAKHIRESVPFGNMNWDLPVNYTKFEDGGRCVVGCHAPKEYHR